MIQFKRKTLSLAVAVTCAAVTAGAIASSHREAPNITRHPALDSTDFYAFNSYEQGREDYVTFIANYIPLQDAYGGPNYFAMDPNAHYAIHIDSDGDAVEDLSFVFKFNNMLAADNEGIALPIGPEGEQKMVKVPLKNVGGISADDSSAANFSEMYSLTMVTCRQARALLSLLPWAICLKSRLITLVIKPLPVKRNTHAMLKALFIRSASLGAMTWPKYLLVSVKTPSLLT